jgi:hypothetical protein
MKTQELHTEEITRAVSLGLTKAERTRRIGDADSQGRTSQRVPVSKELLDGSGATPVSVIHRREISESLSSA